MIYLSLCHPNLLHVSDLNKSDDDKVKVTLLICSGASLSDIVMIIIITDCIIIRACQSAALWCDPEAGGWPPAGPGLIWQLHSCPRARWQRGRGHPRPRCGHEGRLQSLPREIRSHKQKKTKCRVEGCHYHIKLVLLFPILFYWLVKCKSLFEI